MKNKKLIVSISILCLLIVLYIGTFAYYRIVRNGNIQANMGTFSFNVSHNNETFASINLADTMESSLSSNGYISPGSSGKFDLLVDASGGMTDVEYTITFNRTNVPSNMNFYLNKEKTNKIDSSKTVGGYFDFDEAVRSRTYVIYWEWPFDSDNDEDSNFQNKDILLNVEVVGKQSAGRAIMLNGDAQEHSGVTAVGMWSSPYISIVKTINFLNDLSDMPSSCTEENLCWDITDAKSKYPVYHYLKQNETDTTKYDAYIVSEKKIYAPVDSSGIFELYVIEGSSFTDVTQFKSSVEAINFNGNFDTSKVTNMYAMFATLRKIENIDLSNFDTSQVTNMSQLFYVCSQLKDVDLSTFDTAKVTNMNRMFSCCSGLVELDLTPLDTSNVTNMYAMFDGSQKLQSVDLSSFNTSKVTNMQGMFGECSSLKNINLSNFNTSSVTNMESMFYMCTSLKSVDVSSFDTSNVTNMKGMFFKCTSLESVDVSGFDTSNVTNFHQMFYSCKLLKFLAVDKFDTSKVTKTRYMFAECTNLTATFNVMSTSIVDYQSMFENAATASGAKITVNYVAAASDLADNLISSKSANSNVVKGSQI